MQAKKSNFFKVASKWSVSTALHHLKYRRNGVIFYPETCVNTNDRKMQMDEIDCRILNILRKNARISNQELAKRINLSPSAALERVKKLYRDGIISGCETRINCAKLGLGLTVLISIVTDEKLCDHHVAQELAKFPEIVEIYDISGDASYLLKVVTCDTNALHELMNRIGQIDGVKSSKTTLVLGMFKEGISPEISLPQIR